MANKSKLYPWSDIIITTKPPEETTDQGVVLGTASEDTKTKKPEKGIIVAIGDTSDESMSMRKFLDKLEIGDMVFYERYTSNEILDEGIEYNFIRFRNLMGYKKLK